MDPLTASVVVILGKYALDKGVELGKEVGPKALETAKEMFQVVLERAKKVAPHTAQNFPQNPEGYKVPLADALDTAVKADPDLFKQLEALLTRYEKEAKNAAATGQAYQATQSGSGGLAQDHSAAAGAGGIAVGRDVHGGAHTPGRGEEERG